MDSLTLMDSIDSIILLELMQLPYRDTFIIKKNRLMRETQKFKWREKGEHMYKDYKGSKTRTKYKFVPAVNGWRTVRRKQTPRKCFRGVLTTWL